MKFNLFIYKLINHIFYIKFDHNLLVLDGLNIYLVSFLHV